MRISDWSSDVCSSDLRVFPKASCGAVSKYWKRAESNLPSNRSFNATRSPRADLINAAGRRSRASIPRSSNRLRPRSIPPSVVSASAEALSDNVPSITRLLQVTVATMSPPGTDRRPKWQRYDEGQGGDVRVELE